jgi:hypothetical protein
LENRQKDVFFPRPTILFPEKKMYIPSPLFGIFDFFVFFNFFTSLKKNKRMLRYKGGTSVAVRKLVPSAWNILMLRERRHAHDKDTQGKFLHGSRYQIAREKVLQGFCLRNALKAQLIATWSPH